MLLNFPLSAVKGAGSSFPESNALFGFKAHDRYLLPLWVAKSMCTYIKPSIILHFWSLSIFQVTHQYIRHQTNSDHDIISCWPAKKGILKWPAHHSMMVLTSNFRNKMVSKFPNVLSLTPELTWINQSFLLSRAQDPEESEKERVKVRGKRGMEEKQCNKLWISLLQADDQLSKHLGEQVSRSPPIKDFSMI